MTVGDKIRGFFADVKDKFITVGDALRGRVKQAGATVGDAIARIPGGVEEARAWLVKQGVEVSKGAGEMLKNVVSGGGQGLGVVVENTFGKSPMLGPVMLGGLGLAALLAFKVL